MTDFIETLDLDLAGHGPDPSDKLTKAVDALLRAQQDLIAAISSEDDLLSTTQASALLRRSRETLKIWRHEGRGPSYVKIGNRVMYRRSSIDRFLNSSRKQPS